jgi:hypothetical protein
MLHHLVGLLLRALNALVTGAKPLQVQFSSSSSRSRRISDGSSPAYFFFQLN